MHFGVRLAKIEPLEDTLRKVIREELKLAK